MKKIIYLINEYKGGVFILLCFFGVLIISIPPFTLLVILILSLLFTWAITDFKRFW